MDMMSTETPPLYDSRRREPEHPGHRIWMEWGFHHAEQQFYKGYPVWGRWKEVCGSEHPDRSCGSVYRVCQLPHAGGHQCGCFDPGERDAGASEIVGKNNTTGSDWTDRTSNLADQAPIKIPSNATVKFQVKNGYDQITFKWSEKGYTYEVRWHTKTPRAPDGQGNTWVVTRIRPGTPTGQMRTQHILVGNQWIPRYQWQNAIDAYRDGTATAEQLELLRNGHWEAP